MLASNCLHQLSYGANVRFSKNRQLVVRNAVHTSLRVPCAVDLERLGRKEGQTFPLNIHGVGKAGELAAQAPFEPAETALRFCQKSFMCLVLGPVTSHPDRPVGGQVSSQFLASLVPPTEMMQP